MNFLFITSNDWAEWGGSEELWGQTARKLVAQGHQVYVSVRDWHKLVPQLQELADAGCVVQPRGHTLYTKVARRLRRCTWHELILEKFPRCHLTIISQGANTDGVRWMKACQYLGRRYCTIAQAASEQIWPGDEEAELLAKCYELAEKAYFVSQRNLELTRVQTATELRRSAVIRNPFNVDYAQSWQWPDGGGDQLRLACVGRLHAPAKGQDLLLQVLAGAKWRDRSVTVSLYGKGVNERALKRLAALYNLSSVEFCGHVDGVEEIWKQCHALVLPSRYEGLPLAVVEAMLCGRPCIVTDVAGNTEVVHDNDTGFIAKAASVGCLDDALERAWQQRESLRQYGKRAYDRIRELVPSNPVAIFAEELVRLAGASSPR